MLIFINIIQILKYIKIYYIKIIYQYFGILRARTLSETITE